MLMPIANNYIAASGGSDPYFSDVTLLLHMDGADASTTFTDSSSIGNTVTANGNAQIDTAQSKFGGASGLFDGSGDHLSIPYSASYFDWWLEDFTVESWVYASSFSTWTSANSAPVMIGHQDPTGLNSDWAFGPMSDDKLCFYYFNGSQNFLKSTGTVPKNEWVHIEFGFDQSAGDMMLFINGTKDGTGTKSGTPASGGSNLVVGQGRSKSITGWVDDLRITKGTVRHTANFTPPTSAHPDS